MSRCLRTIIVLLFCAVNGLTQAHADILIGSYSGDVNVRRQILSFSDDANGPSAIPLRVMGGPNSGLIEPVSGVYEPEENVLYVGDFRGESIRVFSVSNTNGDPAPLRAMGTAYLGQVRSLAVDAAHDELLVVDGTYKVFDRDANGNPFPKRYLDAGGPGSDTQQHFPSSIVYLPATDEIAEADVGFAPTFARRVMVFNRTDSGNVAPKRIIEGTNTMFGNNAGSLAYDPASRKLFVGAYSINPDSSHSARIVVFDDMANGDVVPLRTIAGAATGLELPGTSIIGGLAIDPVRQRLIVSIGDYAAASNNKILVFALTANGNAAPLQTIAGAQSSLLTNLGAPIWMPGDRIFRNGFE